METVKRNVGNNTYVDYYRNYGVLCIDAINNKLSKFTFINGNEETNGTTTEELVELLPTKANFIIYLDNDSALLEFMYIRDALVNKFGDYSCTPKEISNAFINIRFEKFEFRNPKRLFLADTEDVCKSVGIKKNVGEDCKSRATTLKLLLDNFANSYGIRKSFDMPYTPSGILRKDILRKAGNYHYKAVSNSASFEEFQHFKKATHCGLLYMSRFDAGRKLSTKCYDFRSSYPFVMLTEKFPSSHFNLLDGELDIETILDLSSDTAFYMTVDFEGLKCTGVPMIHKDMVEGNANIINKYVYGASECSLVVNDVDFKTILENYTYKTIKLSQIYYAHKDYLPSFITDTIGDLYIQKCEAKNKDKTKYHFNKTVLNMVFGIQMNVYADNEDDYNIYINRRKYIENYSVGQYCLSYALRNLVLFGQRSVKGDWIYSDTDSVYATEFYENEIDKWNEECRNKLIERGFTFDLFPGEAEFEGDYKEFKVLKPKCYAKVGNKGLEITVSGCKKSAVEQLQSIDEFEIGFVFRNVKKILVIDKDSAYIQYADFTISDEDLFEEFINE